MKKMILCGALAFGIAASTGSAQSVNELLGITIPAAQEPPTPADTGHASAEEAPFYVAWTVNPVIAGTINTKPNDQNNTGGISLGGGKISFDLGVGTDITFGWRIPDTYFFLQVSGGFTWNSVKDFQAPAPLTNLPVDGELFDGSGNMYQIPILFTPGFEFELPGGWPFMSGGLIRFGPTVGAVYQNLKVTGIQQEIKGALVPNFSWEFQGKNWLFAYGAMLDLEFFLDHNISLVLGYQFMGTTGADYGNLTGTPTAGGQQLIADKVETNFTYTSIVKCGLSFYF